MATVEAQLRALEDEKVAEAGKHAWEMRTLESTLNAAHAGKQVNMQQCIAHCMFKDAQTEIWLTYDERQHQCACLLLLGTNVDGTCLEGVQKHTTQQQHVQSDT